MGNIENLISKGIKDGKRTFCGPRIVQIDLTGLCNNSCIGCWVHSPYIKYPTRDKNVTLSFNRVKELIKNLYNLGTQEIFLSGAGEPFLHPNIIEIIELIKNKGFKLNIITNFTLIDKERAKILTDLKVDLITASIWTGTPETYLKTHPNKTKEDFYKLNENLKYLAILKSRANKHLPNVKIYNVICNLNYHEIQNMVDFALNVGAEFIEFQVMDIIEGCTSPLALSPDNLIAIREQYACLKNHCNLYLKELEFFSTPNEQELKEFPGRFFKIPPGFVMNEVIEDKCASKRALHTLTCPKGFTTHLSSQNPLIEEDKNKITFSFSKCDCLNCPLFKSSCPVNSESQICFKFLKILGFGSFMRRINSPNVYEQLYEQELVNNLPCYVGWTYSRVLSTGEIIPCCKSANKALGNINRNKFLFLKNKFSDIWNSPQYQEFRYNAKHMPKSTPYFREINCFKSCDNVGINMNIKEAIFEEENKPKLGRLPPAREVQGIESLFGVEKIIIPASQYISGNLNPNEHSFGKDIIIDGGNGFGFAEYEIFLPEDGNYEFWAYYASDESRPVELYLDGKLLEEKILSFQTGGWTTEFLRWFNEKTFYFSSGRHTLRIYSKGLIPHIHSFALVKESKLNGKETKIGLSEKIYSKPKALHFARDKFKTLGLYPFILKLLDYVKSDKLRNSYLDVLGIFNGRYAFKGPYHVQIDLTDHCNNNCIACWCNSPLLEEKALAKENKHTLPLGLVKELLDDLSAMGTKEIYFSGGGEPFCHPQIMEILTYVKKKGYICYINTNFTLLDREKINKLVNLGIEHLTVSTWAATATTYAQTHPNKNEDAFRQITENLKYLNAVKRKVPYIKLYNVIFNRNYHELKDMVSFAQETGCESVEFTLVDTIPDKTERLLLNNRQIKELQKNVHELSQNMDKDGYIGKVLLFRFDAFSRRVSSSADLATARYDRNIIDKIPCYIGWCFARIMPNGDLNSCLKAHRIPSGNLYQSSFPEIWNSKKQIFFRKKTLVYEKSDSFFRLLGNDPDIEEAGCYKSCDDIGRNVYTHNRLMSLTYIERQVLKTVARIRTRPNFGHNHKALAKDLLLRGIQSGRKAFIGPEQVVIDITNRCNQRCVGCWLFSPHISKKPDPHWLRQEIDFSVAKRLIKSLADIGTKRIRFTGGGEPFMHPKIMPLVEYVKSQGLICCLTTNFSLLDKKQVRDLIKLDVDELAISLWSSTKETYQKTHLGESADTFGRIKENLMTLTQEKNKSPFVTLCNVICKINYQELEEMFRFALETKVDGVYFTLIDAVTGTETLLLNEEEKQSVLKQTDSVKKAWQELASSKKINLDYFDGFVARLKQNGSLEGRYDQERVDKIPCYAGWIFARILADGGVAPCCRGVKKLMGNINREDFHKVWLNAKYNEFRAKAKYLDKNDPYFSEIGCNKICDNMMHNEQMHKLIHKTK